MLETQPGTIQLDFCTVPSHFQRLNLGESRNNEARIRGIRTEDVDFGVRKKKDVDFEQ